MPTKPQDTTFTYIDSSILLRFFLNEPEKWSGLKHVTFGVTSELTKVECFRTLDRLRLMGQLDDMNVSHARNYVSDFLRRVEIVQLNKVVLDLAAEPFPTSVRTLDAIHLASAVLWQKARAKGLNFATHDRQLDVGAKALGFTSPVNPG